MTLADVTNTPARTPAPHACDLVQEELLPGSLQSAWAAFEAERANLVARTQQADSLIAAALSQLQHPPLHQLLPPASAGAPCQSAPALALPAAPSPAVAVHQRRQQQQERQLGEAEQGRRGPGPEASCLPALASHQPCFSLGVDWSAVPLRPTATCGDAFLPGTSIKDFACQEDEVAAYLTSQHGLRDGKRRRLAAGMLAQCLHVPPAASSSWGPRPHIAGPIPLPRPVLPPPFLSPLGRGAAAASTGRPEDPMDGECEALQDAEQPALQRRVSSVGAHLAAMEEAAMEAEAECLPAPLVDCPTPARVVVAAGGSIAPSPAAGLPSRTPKRKRSDSGLLDGEGLPPADLQTELVTAFDQLQTMDEAMGAAQLGQQAQQQQGQQGAADWDTFALWDAKWHGAGGEAGGGLQQGGRAPQQQQRRTPGARRGRQRRGTVAGCAIS